MLSLLRDLLRILKVRYGTEWYHLLMGAAAAVLFIALLFMDTGGW